MEDANIHVQLQDLEKTLTYISTHTSYSPTVPTIDAVAIFVSDVLKMLDLPAHAQLHIPVPGHFLHLMALLLQFLPKDRITGFRDVYLDTKDYKYANKHQCVCDRLEIGKTSEMVIVHMLSNEPSSYCHPSQTSVRVDREELIKLARFDCIRLSLGTVDLGNSITARFYFDLTWIDDFIYILFTVHSHSHSISLDSTPFLIPRYHTKISAALLLTNPLAYDDINRITPLCNSELKPWLVEAEKLPTNLLDKFEDICQAENVTTTPTSHLEHGSFDESFDLEPPEAPEGYEEYMAAWRSNGLNPRKDLSQS